jgi:hypothetical protein
VTLHRARLQPMSVSTGSLLPGLPGDANPELSSTSQNFGPRKPQAVRMRLTFDSLGLVSWSQPCNPNIVRFPAITYE